MGHHAAHEELPRRRALTRSSQLNADIATGTRSAAFVHLANISLRTGRKLTLAQSTGRIAGDDQAEAMRTRDYREPYVVPAAV
jgi:hypothetical protein